MSYKAEFLPYMGKNDFSALWTNSKEYGDICEFDFSTDFKIDTIFIKNEAVSSYISKAFGRSARLNIQPFVYFEKLPINFDEKLFQYQYGDFVYSNALFSKEMDMSSTGIFYKIDGSSIIQLF
jgi:CRISPR-associated protein Cas5h